MNEKQAAARAEAIRRNGIEGERIWALENLPELSGTDLLLLIRSGVLTADDVARRLAAIADCEHRGVFADDRPTRYCVYCGWNVPRELL